MKVIVVSVLMTVFASSLCASESASSKMSKLRNPFKYVKEIVTKKVETPKKAIVNKRKMTKKVKKGIVLNGIFYDEHESYVLINQQLVKLGDTIDGWLITEISETVVHIKKGSVTKELKIK